MEEHVDLGVAKEKMIHIATLFYQEKITEAMNEFMDVVGIVVQIPEFSELLNPLFDAVEQKDYVLVADIFYHEMAMCIQ